MNQHLGNNILYQQGKIIKNSEQSNLEQWKANFLYVSDKEQGSPSCVIYQGDDVPH